jgi:hypothetical protein
MPPAQESPDGDRAANAVPWPVGFARVLLLLQAVLWALCAVGLVVTAAVLFLDLRARDASAPSLGGADADAGAGFADSVTLLGILGLLFISILPAFLAWLSWKLAFRMKPRHVHALAMAIGFELFYAFVFAFAAGKFGGFAMPAGITCAVLSLMIACCLLNQRARQYVVARPVYRDA